MKRLNQSAQAQCWYEMYGPGSKIFTINRLKNRGVVMVVKDEFQSPPSPTIPYTYNDTLEGLGCCELAELVSTHTIWVRKVSMGQPKFVPSQS